MEFRVLGPLAVRDGDAELPLPRGKQRGLLAVLLLHANELVSIERLVDGLWAESPPVTASHALEVYVSGLRQILDGRGSPARHRGEPRLLTRPGGYLLRVEPDELDLARFEQLCARARRALIVGDTVTAARTFREAESLWRGSPLTDVAREPFAPAAIARLEEVRLAAVGDRIEAELGLGHHVELVGELEALIAAEALRERPYAQLMLALYRSGRQAEALSVYRQLRRTLVVELGLEPSPDLQRLELAILHQDEALDAPTRVGIEDDKPDRAADRELKLVTVLFAALAETGGGMTDPERRQDFRRRFLAEVTAELAPSGALVAELADSTVMATFGSPAAQEDHADRALRSATGIRRRVGEALGTDSGADPLVRIGMESGEVITGGGTGDQPPVSGAAVDAAAALLRAAAPGEILVGDRAFAVLRETFTLSEPMGPPPGGLSEVTRSSDATGYRRLIDGSVAARPGSGLGRFSRTFVGRSDESTVLDVAYRRAVTAGQPRLITIVGEPGVGKSTLVRRWIAAVREDSPGTVVRIGRCPAYGDGITYRPLAEVLREHLEIMDSDPPERLIERPADGVILGLTADLDTAGDLHPMTVSDHLHEAWVALLDAAVAERPLIVVVEDVHWAEAPLLDLIERLVRDVTGPLVVLTTARPEIARIRPAWVGTHGRATAIFLEPLSSDEVDEMVAALLDGSVPPAIKDIVVDRAEGNPFFVEELIVAMAERGILAREGGGWRFDRGAGSLAVPDSVRALLAARLDLLSVVDKAALQAGAVIGRRFEPEAIVELLGEAGPDFETLRGRDFIRRSTTAIDGTSVGYAFKHALIREVAYDSLPKSRRARLHATYAERVERLGEGRDDHAATLAHHYAESVRLDDVDLVWAAEPDRLAGLRQKARDWSFRAARLAVARHAIDEAVKLLERALTLDALVPDRLVEPFGWRALGIVRDDDGLIEVAAAPFDELGPAWHRERTWAAVGASTGAAIDGVARRR